MTTLALAALAMVAVGLLIASHLVHRLDARVRSLERSRDRIEDAAERAGRILDERGKAT